jgi:hypothetical protein
MKELEVQILGRGRRSSGRKRAEVGENKEGIQPCRKDR